CGSRSTPQRLDPGMIPSVPSTSSPPSLADPLDVSGRMHREDPKPMTRALIAGRSRVHRDALATVLAQSDRVRVVGTASDRAEVLARLDADRPDIVLIDVTMFDAARTVADIKARTPGVQGVANKEIAGHQGIELATVKNHVHNILNKLHVHKRISAANWYRRGGFHLKLEG